jgi:multidrug efflux pump subunit AcrA (membrane-fusion protein)
LTKYPLWVLTMTIFLAGMAGGCRRASEGTIGEAGLPGTESTPAGTVILTPESIAAGGIAVESARIIKVAGLVRALGEVEFDARRLAIITARTEGRLERVGAYLGDPAGAGQILAEIFSQDYLVLQAEVIQSSRQLERVRGDNDEPGALTMLSAARKKLIPLGLTDAEIDALVAEKSIRPFLPVRAAIAGVIIESNAIAGGQVESGASLFKIADPAILWACIHIYEKDLAVIRPGMKAVLHTQAYPGEEFGGRLVLVGEIMDAKTRTVEGRIEVPNPTRRLKPGMYIEASLETPEERRALVVPESAVQEFQSRTVVFVHSTPTSFVLRPVETGEHIGGIVEITQGLTEGEKVVTSGSFLVKSEMLKKSLGD